MNRKSLCWQVEQPFSSEQMTQPVQLPPGPVPTASQTRVDGGGQWERKSQTIYVSNSDCIMGHIS